MSFTLSALSASIASKDGLNHAVLQSLLNFATAKKTDELDAGHHRQGWWAGQNVGARSWTLARSKNTPEVRTKLKRFTEQALQWLIDEGYAKSVKVEIDNQGAWVNRVVTIELSATALFKEGESLTVAVPYNFNL